MGSTSGSNTTMTVNGVVQRSNTYGVAGAGVQQNNARTGAQGQ